jgi:molybdate transport system ATP-binding protein
LEKQELSTPFLKVEELTVRLNGKPILNNISFTVNKGETWAITGPSGSGKTTLLKAIAGKVFHTGKITISQQAAPYKKIVLVEQQHHFKNLSNTSNFYYQQRFNSMDAEDAITVEEDLKHVLDKTLASKDELDELADQFHIKKLFSERLIQLSNGENKRLQIVKALLLHPTILLLDNPFTGLDVDSRQKLETVLVAVINKGIHIVMVTASSHLPHFVTNVLSLTYTSYKAQSVTNSYFYKATNNKQSLILNHELLKALTSKDKHVNSEFVVKMINVAIKYDGKKILDGINWQVRDGERWALSGPNGSGKSTLLSLINADNPQAYANEIYLFDRKRGTGETIWDIKKKIGFVSPELHLYFEKGITCSHVVASGLFDTIGLFRKITEQQSTLVLKWMQLLQIEHLKNKFLFQLSNSEQRLVLLARALVKNPPLLILDEPCQGLDDEQVQLFKNIVNEICIAGNKTIIYVSHYIEEIPECVTKYIKLKDGKIDSLIE